MNICAKKGDKVVFRSPDGGNLGEQERAKKHLVLNMVYTVEKTRIYGFHTDVYLQEVKGVAFNSVQFDDIDNIEGKVEKQEKAYVRIDRECGMTHFCCESCKAGLNEIIIEHLEEIIMAKVEGKTDSPKLHCPKCKKRLDFSKLGVKTEIIPQK